MSGKRRRFDRDYKLSAVRLLESSGGNLEQVSRGLGISSSMLRRWRNQIRERGAESFSETGRMERSEVLRLRRENKDLRRQLEFLKKTLGFETVAKRKGTKP